MTPTFPKMIFGTRPAVVLQVRQRLAREPLTFPKRSFFGKVLLDGSPSALKNFEGSGLQPQVSIAHVGECLGVDHVIFVAGATLDLNQRRRVRCQRCQQLIGSNRECSSNTGIRPSPAP
jgi:hypothetical protein